MPRTNREWILGLATLFLSIGASIGAAAFAVGKLDARVASVELRVGESVPKEAWDEFTLDVRQRLDRIERKIDASDHK